MNFNDIFSNELLISLMRAAVLVFLGIPLFYLIAKWMEKLFTKQVSAQRGMVAAKIVRYTGLIIICISVLKEFGFSLGPLLGAAGVIGIAVGFASQTSVSNIISGIFLIAERPFVVGDVIQAGGTVGLVLSIDTLSVKLRTFDNKFVRIPNETLLKNEVITFTHFPIRRIDLSIGIAYKEDVARVRKVLLDLAWENPLCLQEPKPVVNFVGFGNSSIDLMFAVWCVKDNFLTLKNSILEEVKKCFDEQGIEIPFPHLSFYVGSETQPLPIEIKNFDKYDPEKQSI